ncbi:hypothetical protein ACIQMR_37325 [Streptomyces sp. NPDC091376]|uniref:hypothetical protein n=1 Tax=Streptomyces sp. NPDC091376 TaxID=3365994 RepID=UPI00382A4321
MALAARLEVGVQVEISGQQVAQALDAGKVIMYGYGIHWYIIHGCHGRKFDNVNEAVRVTICNPSDGSEHTEFVHDLRGQFIIVGR